MIASLEVRQAVCRGWRDRVTTVTSISLIELDVVGHDEQPIEGLTLAVAYFALFLNTSPGAPSSTRYTLNLRWP